MTLLEIEKSILSIENNLIEENKKYEDYKYQQNNILLSLKDKKRLLLKDLNVDKIAKAREILSVSFSKRGFIDLIDLAIKDLINGCKFMKKEFYGAKDYDRWSGQYSCHPYGYGPAHGSLVFSIGLKQEARNKDLTEEEIESCLYYLNNFFEIHENLTKSKTS